LQIVILTKEDGDVEFLERRPL